MFSFPFNRVEAFAGGTGRLFVAPDALETDLFEEEREIDWDILLGMPFAFGNGEVCKGFGDARADMLDAAR